MATDGGVTPNSYTLQLNTGMFSTPVCSGTCQAAAQFIYSATQGPGPVIFVQFWYKNYATGGGGCPDSTWTQLGVDCFTTSTTQAVPAQPIGNLANLVLTGEVIDSSHVAVFLSIGNDTVLGETVDDPVGVGGSSTNGPNWTEVEFGVFGDGGNGEAHFDGSPTLVAQLLTNGTAPPPYVGACLQDGFTTETNNLFAPWCSTLAGSLSAVQITEGPSVNIPASTSPLPINQIQLPVAYQQYNSNSLGIDTGGPLHNVIHATSYAMKPGTLPSLATLPGGNGGYEVGFQTNDGYWAYYKYNWDGSQRTSETKTAGQIRAGTSPSLTIMGSSLAFAFQGTDGHLWIGQTGEGSGVRTGAVAAPNTSPSIAWLPGGQPLGETKGGELAVAYQGSNGHLWISESGPSGEADTGFAMLPGTSPSIAPQNGAFVAFAFQGTNGDLWFGKGDPSSTGFDTGHAMKAGTSPSVAVPFDSEMPIVAFQGSNGDLFYFQYGFATDTGLKIMPGHSPSVVALPGRGWQIAYDDGIRGQLYLYVYDTPFTDVNGPYSHSEGVGLN